MVLADAGHGQAEERRLVAIDAHRQFGAAFLLLQSRVGNARRRVEQGLQVLRYLRRGLEIVAEDLDRQAAVAAAATHAAHHVLLAAGGPRPHDHTGNTGQLTAQLHRNLIVAALPLVLRRETHVDVGAAGVAAAESAATAAAAVGLRNQHRGFRHGLLDLFFETDRDRLGPLDARALRQLDVDGDFAFIGLRLELEADSSHQEHRDRKQREAGGKHRRPMLQRQVQHARVELVDLVQPAIDHPVEAGHRAGLAVDDVRRIEQALSRAPGTIVTATSSDIASENDTDRRELAEHDARARRSGTASARTPRCGSSVEARIADQTSSEPSIAAVIRSLPISRWR
jgi:hypothetical protein